MSSTSAIFGAGKKRAAQGAHGKSKYFAKKRRRNADAPQKWKVEAIAQVATEAGVAQWPWESAADFARRVSAEQRSMVRATQKIQFGIGSAYMNSQTAAVFGAADISKSTRLLADVKPLPDTHLSFIGVYVLQSIANPRMTYVGFTVDPANRIRQHNGLISGGAKFTKMHRPWKMVLHVSGFPSKVEAQQFEAALTKHKWVRVARSLLVHPVLRNVQTDIPALKMRLAQLLQFAGEYDRMPLVTTWLCEESRKKHEIDFSYLQE